MYRDDRDAALARIASLEDELARAKADLRPDPPTLPIRRAEPVVGVWIAAALGLLIVLGLFCSVSHKPAVSSGRPPGSTFVEDQVWRELGDLRRQVREQEPRAILIELHAIAITKDGSMRAPDGEIEAVFHSAGEPHCVFARRLAEGWEPPLDLTTRCATEQLTANAPDLVPACSTWAIWRRAIADGAPEDAAADLRIGGGHWDFTIGDWHRRYVDDCTRF